MKTKFLLLSFLLASSAVFSLFAQQLEDKVYKDHIQSVRLFPEGATIDASLNAPITSLQSATPLVLLFDDLAFDPQLYTAKLIHCDADWQKSQLKDNDFLRTFNEFNVQNYDYSVNTRIPYIHYQFELPAVTKSGNYIVKVYSQRDESDVILTKRFMIYEEVFNVGASIVPPSQTAARRNSQQINLVVNYSAGEVTNPDGQIKVVIRQNQRWDNAKFLSKPTFMNESSKILRYESFDGGNTFDAGNEFRFVDLRFIRANGVNIANMRVEPDVIFADGNINKPRPETAYSQYLDLNGQYLVETKDRPGGNMEVESEYMLMTFRLAIEQTSEPIYLIGSLTNWGKAAEAKMEWDPKMGVYTTSLLVKQGWYDYQYAFLVDGKFDPQSFEGSYFETENEYEVMVYFRNLGSRYDQLVGYVYLQPNRRRL
ncbi:type IX secretion system plug protein domain-containing protein [Algoriphagus aquimarinus]|uniref:type IX secretion system plug protein n=1 Tax=Algoriphagus aquimarinus TaxID=237018 RepID=UPI0030DBB4F8|tara:strand:- start:20255 stop:21532 length:1278 start_codon:yes stop_codon:yes gene_type:complete